VSAARYRCHVITANQRPEDSTARLGLYRPVQDDSADLYQILSDPAVWAHYPSLRHTDPDQTARWVASWVWAWERDGLGTWIARDPGTDAVLGYGGCWLRNGTVWNLGYRFAPAAQGRGLATELARKATDRANTTLPAVPVVAYLLEHNRASAAVAEKLGMQLVDRGPDQRNPDRAAMRLIYADRELTDAQLMVARG